MPEHVPTARELVDMGLAKQVHQVTELRNKQGRKTGKTRTTTYYEISDEGHALLGKIMRANAQEAIDAGETAWVRPPSSGPVIS